MMMRPKVKNMSSDRVGTTSPAIRPAFQFSHQERISSPGAEPYPMVVREMKTK